MKRILSIVAIGLLGVSGAAAQTSASAQAGASAQGQTTVQADKSGAKASGSGAGSASASTNAGKNSASIANGTKIDAALVKPLDAKRNKPGDPVEARTTQDVKQDGKVVLKKGTPLMGHVTQAQARADGQAQSQLGVVFDRAIPRKGEEVPFSATIQALAVAQSATTAAAGADDVMSSGGAMGGMSGGARSGGGLVGGVASTAGATAGTVVNTSSTVSSATGGTLNTVSRSTGAVGGLTSAGQLASNSSGVFGLQGLSLDSAASSATQGSMIVSSTKNVHLDSGTQMLLSASGQAK
ncbi:MAG: hypothetical protein LAO08_05850 [Acidobacteriia bacterium]|nr:hypothetical protein [Terriglobia bacterium]